MFLKDSPTSLAYPAYRSTESLQMSLSPCFHYDVGVGLLFPVCLESRQRSYTEYIREIKNGRGAASGLMIAPPSTNWGLKDKGVLNICHSNGTLFCRLSAPVSNELVYFSEEGK